jgi:hypothetical protein
MDKLKVYGFPRSGNHLLMELLGRNLYNGADLSSPGGEVGHWADRVKVGGPQFGALTGHHGPPENYDPRSSVYVYRDGRAVAASLYRSDHFKHPEWAGMTFSEFIREPLDWAWSPGAKANRGKTVVEHWLEHLQLWKNAPAAYKVQYEWMTQEPGCVLDMIASRMNLPLVQELDAPDTLVGWFPSGGMRDGWRDLWGYDELDYWWSVVPKGFYGVSDG